MTRCYRLNHSIPSQPHYTVSTTVYRLNHSIQSQNTVDNRCHITVTAKEHTNSVTHTSITEFYRLNHIIQFQPQYTVSTTVYRLATLWIIGVVTLRF
ncbi:hypothetical protein BaRGS_00006773 [Batillaria attramentaria]|uniref:Uncharacterized protein n=1 Tax=Batillaria attramentaria TaxID=370345 RepID=A0ABD0LS97_9CAEN